MDYLRSHTDRKSRCDSVRGSSTRDVEIQWPVGVGVGIVVGAGAILTGHKLETDDLIRALQLIILFSVLSQR